MFVSVGRERKCACCRWTMAWLPEIPFPTLLRQAKHQQLGRGGDGDELLAAGQVGHGRGIDRAVYPQMPERLAALQVERQQLVFGTGGKDDRRRPCRPDRRTGRPAPWGTSRRCCRFWRLSPRCPGRGGAACGPEPAPRPRYSLPLLKGHRRALAKPWAETYSRMNRPFLWHRKWAPGNWCRPRRGTPSRLPAVSRSVAGIDAYRPALGIKALVPVGAHKAVWPRGTGPLVPSIA